MIIDPAGGRIPEVSFPCGIFYSVAQHCTTVSDVCLERGGSLEAYHYGP
jgi:hypothetical protein